MTKGNISERDFEILIKLSGIHSQKAILALKKYYVDGVIRKIACFDSNLSQSYFSIAARKFEFTLMLINELSARVYQ
ncbi:transcriptional regulator [Salmonella enterica]|uniref:Transcriptional regulator n=2 Tax=Salmonella enterica TaxID=28901 RepID=A0A5V0QGN8_SALER|nr:transcriptional regulator [Salmonella enterica]ECO1004064.1 transcriptional regulator [Salmonella enterica subsp. enterica serovar Give]ECS7052008.1 transcriptional regulator [Salmonella enterica subsp. enterica serovar Oranienburg]EDI3199460.1 transcriptional regulator [Salmonella enterica subsp. enterica serovar Rubislaw]EDR1012846.1 transcriptional regulator [Salmonella enterica subsp. enterica serovar Glostrup]ELJ2723157.1 transcriptional regulator [Salmonella enterica subsp. enterica]